MDALPPNIVIDAQGNYHIIDQEWETEKRVIPDFIFFRALLWFGHDNQGLLKAFFQEISLTCLYDFIDFGFKSLSIDLTHKITDFIIREEAIQFECSGQRNLQPIQALLNAPFDYRIEKCAWLKLCWAADGQDFSDTRSRELNYIFENGAATIQCPFASDGLPSRIRLMPLHHSTEQKLFFIRKMTLAQIANRDAGKTIIWSMEPKDIGSSNIRYNHFVLPLEKLNGAFIASGHQAFLDFSMDFSIVPRSDTDSMESGRFELEIEIAGDTVLGPSFCTEYLSRQASTVDEKNNRFQKKIIQRNNCINRKNSEISVKRVEAQHLEAQVHDINKRMRLKDDKNCSTIF